MEVNLFEKYEAGVLRMLFSECMFALVQTHVNRFFWTEWLCEGTAWNFASSLWRKKVVNMRKHGYIGKAVEITQKIPSLCFTLQNFSNIVLAHQRKRGCLWCIFLKGQPHVVSVEQ